MTALTITPFTPGVPVTKPGLYAIGEADYHADKVCEAPSLSSTLAREVLKSPLHAWHKHPRLNVTPDEDETTEPKKTMDFGSAIHALLLGRGAGLFTVDAKDWKTKAAQQQRDDAREAGLTPILAKDHRRALKLVEAVRRQVEAYGELPDLFGPGTIFEHAVVWQEQGLWCRAMLDIIRVYSDFIAIVDFKSTDGSADPVSVQKQTFRMGYDIQKAFYRRGIRRLIGPDALPVRCFLLVQERSGPGALSIEEMDADVLLSADKEVSNALAKWETCLKANEWPGYPPYVATITLPSHIENARLEREVADDALAEAGYRFALPLPETRAAADLEVLRAG